MFLLKIVIIMRFNCCWIVSIIALDISIETQSYSGSYKLSQLLFKLLFAIDRNTLTRVVEFPNQSDSII